jgi:MFS family permease
MGRTLLIGGVFALLAMIYVPTPRRGYRLIFSSGDTSVAFFQLLVNVVFAALLGAILATIIPKLPWWAWRWITGIAVIALLCIGGVAWRNFTAAAADWARFDEEFADSQLAYHYPDAAKFTLRSAARNWRLALRFDEATRVENRIKELQKHAAQAPQAPARNFGFVPDPSPTPKKHSSFDPNSAEPIPRARPVKKSMFDDLIPARTATPGR